MLKSFDFFRKIQTDQELTSTTGGMFTLIALAAAALLIFYSLQDFTSQKYYTFLAVKNDDSQFLPMRIDLLFNKMPCQSIQCINIGLQIEFHDELEYLESGLEKKLTMYHVKDGKQQRYQIDNRVLEQEKQRLKMHIQQQYQCRVAGILNLPKTPGTLTFRGTGQNNIIMSLQNNLALKTRMSYRINSLQFGLGNNTFDFPISHKSKNIEQYIAQLEGDINTRQYVQDLTSITDKLDYYNHVKIIPVVLEDGQIDASSTQTNQKYRYSLRAGNHGSFEHTQKLMFMTEIEPINIVYRKGKNSLYDFIVQLLAIVGGTVATIGIVNSISHYLFHIKSD